MTNSIETSFYVDSLNTRKAMIYGCGLAGRWLAANLGDSCVGFIDTDEKKAGLTYAGKKVFSPKQAKKMFSKEMSIVVTVVDIKDVVRQVEAFVPCKVVDMSHTPSAKERAAADARASSAAAAAAAFRARQAEGEAALRGLYKSLK